ncbi:IKBA-like protein [Mya arenaria]|uniref:IKBA-like protein n=1 Tax=Mya arenaria TaxID=6604 RepID=A0ABY7DND9_MYAAR|nr:IKBA-like protein [Mya arenaria]
MDFEYMDSYGISRRYVQNLAQMAKDAIITLLKDTGTCLSKSHYFNQICRQLQQYGTEHTTVKRQKVNIVQNHQYKGHIQTNKQEELIPRLVVATAADSLAEKALIANVIVTTDRDGDNLLFVAIIMRKTKLAMNLINLTTDYSQVRSVNKLRQTALHLAAITNNPIVSRRLVVAGAEIEMQDYNGNTALHIACIQGWAGVVRSLIQHVSYEETKQNSFKIPYVPIPQNFEIRNYDGSPCLMIAICKGYLDIADMLIDIDADINTFDMKTGMTCVHAVTELGLIHLVRYLLSKPNLKINAETYSGYTAMEIAFYRGYADVAALLKVSGANRPRPICIIENLDLEEDRTD